MSDSTVTSGDAGTLVAEGNAALLAGDSYTARQRFRQALERDPERVEAWVGLAGSVRPYREKREHLQRALAIAPDNVEARAVLAQVEARIAAGEVLAPGGVQVREPTPTGLGVAVAPPPDEPVSGADPIETVYCYYHPDRETGLRCTSCDRPICAECVRPAAVGQLCPDCAKARRPVNYQVSAVNLIVVGVVGFLASALVGLPLLFLLGFAGFFSFIVAFLLGPVYGSALVRLLDVVKQNKRGRWVQITFGVCYALGAVPWVMLVFSFGLILFTILVVITAVTQLR